MVYQEDFSLMEMGKKADLPDFEFTTEKPSQIYEVKEESKTEKKPKSGEKENVIFEMYYKGCQMLPAEEWDTFYEKLKQPLDISFRINSIE